MSKTLPQFMIIKNCKCKRIDGLVNLLILNGGQSSVAKLVFYDNRFLRNPYNCSITVRHVADVEHPVILRFMLSVLSGLASQRM